MYYIYVDLNKMPMPFIYKCPLDCFTYSDDGVHVLNCTAYDILLFDKYKVQYTPILL